MTQTSRVTGSDCSKEESVGPFVGLNFCQFITEVCKDICERRERIYTETEQSRTLVLIALAHESTIIY